MYFTNGLNLFIYSLRVFVSLPACERDDDCTNMWGAYLHGVSQVGCKCGAAEDGPFSRLYAVESYFSPQQQQQQWRPNVEEYLGVEKRGGGGSFIVDRRSSANA